MQMKVNASVFNLATLQRLVTSMTAPPVTAYAYRTDVDVVHLNVVDETTNELSVRLAQRIHQYLLQGKFAALPYRLILAATPKAPPQL